MNSLEAIIFDYGGVLTDDQRIRTELAGYDQWLGWPAGTLQYRLGSGPAWEAVSVGAICEEAYWQQVAGDLAGHLPAAFTRFRAGTLTFEALHAEMIALLQGLHGRVRLGLLSNATSSLGAYLRRVRWLYELFDEVIISAEAGVRKPDAEAFLLAARRLGVAPEQALLVDDKARNTAAAQACGMPAVVFHSPEQLQRALQELGIRA